jgi:signal transduction histidine kinase
MLKLAVINTGTGIEPDKIDVTLKSFRQADPSITRKYIHPKLSLMGLEESVME